MIDGCHYKGQSQSTSLTRIYPEEASRRPLLFEVEEDYKRRSGSTRRRVLRNLEEEDQGSTQRRVPRKDRLQESNRGRNRLPRKDRLQESNRGIEYRGRTTSSKKSTEAIDYWSRSEEGSEVEARKEVEAEAEAPKVTRTDYKNTTRRLLIQSIGESPLFDCWIEEYLNTIARGVSGTTTRQTA